MYGRQSPVIGLDRTCRERAPTAEFDPLRSLKGPSTYACQCRLIGHDQTCRGPALPPSLTLSGQFLQSGFGVVGTETYCDQNPNQENYGRKRRHDA